MSCTSMVYVAGNADWSMKAALNSDWLSAYTGTSAAGNAHWSMKAALNSDLLGAYTGP